MTPERFNEPQVMRLDEGAETYPCLLPIKELPPVQTPAPVSPISCLEPAVSNPGLNGEGVNQDAGMFNESRAVRPVMNV